MNDASLEDVSVESQISRAVDEYMAELDRGKHPDADEFARRYPEIAEVLSQILPALQMVRESAAGGCYHNQPPAQISSAEPLGDFRILREVGRGGMGVVYEAEQRSLGRRVALKVLPFAATMDPRHLQRFQNEARAAASLHHAHIVPVFGVGCERGVHYYAMQFIGGQTLAQVIREQKQGPDAPTEKGTWLASELADSERQTEAHMPEAIPSPKEYPASRLPKSARLRKSENQEAIASPKESPGSSPLAPGGTGTGGEGDSPADTAFSLQAKKSTQTSFHGKTYFQNVARIGIEAAEALEHAHSLGIVHRDIKPGNLMLDGNGHLWITDFGLARIGVDSGLTMTGDVLGTLRYMSPEQALAKHGLVDHRTDVYALGATLYELLTLQPAIQGKERQEILNNLTLQEPAAPRKLNRAVPVDLETIVLKAMSKEPEDRYASAKDMAQDLRRYLEDRPIQTRRPSWPDRLLKWSRRHKTVVRAVVAFLLLSLVVVSIALLLVSAEQQRATTALAAKEIALQQKGHALREAQRAEKKAKEKARLAREEWQRAEKNLFKSLSLAAHLKDYLHKLIRDEKGEQAKSLSEEFARYFASVVDSYEIQRDPAFDQELIASSSILKYRTLAETLRGLGAREPAVKLLRKATRLFSGMKVDNPKKRTHVHVKFSVPLLYEDIGRILREMGRCDDAAKAYRQSIVKWDALMASDRPEMHQVYMFTKAIDWYYLGMVQLDGRHFDAAEKSFHHSLDLLDAVEDRKSKFYLPWRGWNREALGDVYAETNRKAQAKKEYDKALQLFTKSGVSSKIARLLVTCPEASLRDPQRAVQIVKGASKPGFLDLAVRNNVFLLSLAYYRLKDYKKASEVAKPLIKAHYHGLCSPTENARVRFLLAAIWHFQGDDKKAHRFWKSAQSYMAGNRHQLEVRRMQAEAAAALGIANPPPKQHEADKKHKKD